MVDDVDGESLFYKVEQWWMDQNLSHINSCKHVCPLSLTTEPSCSFQRSEILGKMAQQGRVIFSCDDAWTPMLQFMFHWFGELWDLSFETIVFNERLRWIMIIFCGELRANFEYQSLHCILFHNVQPPRPPKQNQITGGKIPVPTRTRSSKHHVFSRLRMYPLLFLVEFKWIADGHNQDLRWSELMIIDAQIFQWRIHFAPWFNDENHPQTKIHPYPFSPLNPHIGVFIFDEWSQDYILYIGNRKKKSGWSVPCLKQQKRPMVKFAISKRCCNSGTLGVCLVVKGRVVAVTVMNLRGGFKYFLFSPLFGEDSQFDKYFSDGLKPPTSEWWLNKKWRRNIKKFNQMLPNIPVPWILWVRFLCGKPHSKNPGFQVSTISRWNPQVPSFVLVLQGKQKSKMAEHFGVKYPLPMIECA